jgi:hypothetical protein
MTEAQATELIEAVERLEVLLGVASYFAQVAAFGVCVAAGFLLADLFLRALLIKRIIT